MRIEELSIGDWVTAKLAKWESDDADTTPPLQIKIINSTERHNLYVDLFNPANNTIEHSAFVEDLQPIPITPEILEKNGFELITENNVYEGKLNPKLIKSPVWGLKIGTTPASHLVAKRYTDGSFKITTANLERFKFKVTFIHQLQHIIRLAGIEKEIEYGEVSD